MTTTTDDDDGQRHWYPLPGWQQLVAKHLLRQADLPADRVRLDDGRIVVVGADAIGEGCDDDDD